MIFFITPITSKRRLRFQFSVSKYHVGVNDSDTLYFQPVATKKHDLDLMYITL